MCFLLDPLLNSSGMPWLFTLCLPLLVSTHEEFIQSCTASGGHENPSGGGGMEEEESEG